MIPLTVRSHYSLLRGTASIQKLCRAARGLGYRCLALTDQDNLYGLWSFLDSCKAEGLRPMVGAEVTEPGAKRRAVCLVENNDGYENLCRLLSARHGEEKFDLEKTVIALGRGLVILTADIGLLERWHGEGLSVYAALPCRPDDANGKTYQAAKRLAVPVVATPASFFLQPGDFHYHRLLRAIGCNTSLSRLPPGAIVPSDRFLASPDVYRRRFALWPEAILNTEEIAERCAFQGPRFGTVMPPYASPDGKGEAERLRLDAYRGARTRYGDDLPEEMVDRLEHELRIISSMGYASYFLVVREIVPRGARTCGRGSGAASLVAYCLGITNICPVRHNLYFERFLHPERSDPPDIDVDFAWDERDDILAAVLTRHGGHAAMVSSHILFQPRMAIRETAKVYGIPASEIGRITKKLPWLYHEEYDDGDLLARLRDLPTLKATEFPAPWPEILAHAARLIGTPRHLSVHPGGVVITPAPINSYVPVETSAKGVPVIQWDKDGAEAAGLVKIDLLGNRSLGVIRDTLRSLQSRGVQIHMDRLAPEDDTLTRETIAKGRTMGCFYIESPAMRLLQQKAGVGDFEHLVIHSSIIRPAANDFIREYIRRLRGGNWAPPHPSLADVLDETLGIMVYQEDVSRVALSLAGFSHAEADSLRKVISKKDRGARLADYRDRFFAGARRNGVGEEETRSIWDMIMSFAGYSFCKPHSASYARVSFEAAYLKTHFPAEFMAAVISNGGGYYGTFAYVSEARRLGLAILPPCIMESDHAWTGRDRAVRVGLMAVRELRRETALRIVAERLKEPISTMTEFLERIRPTEVEARNLIHAGALDCLNRSANRAGLLWEVFAWRQKDRNPYAALFPSSAATAPAPLFPPEERMERLGREFASLGFLVEGHPMELFRRETQARNAVPAADLHRFHGRRVWFAGWLVTGKLVRTKKGATMEFLSFEDETGMAETTFFPEAYERHAHLLETGRPYLLHGLVEEDYGAITLTVDGLRRISPDASSVETVFPRHKRIIAAPPALSY